MSISAKDAAWTPMRGSLAPVLLTPLRLKYRFSSDLVIFFCVESLALPRLFIQARVIFCPDSSSLSPTSLFTFQPISNRNSFNFDNNIFLTRGFSWGALASVAWVGEEVHVLVSVYVWPSLCIFGWTGVFVRRARYI